MNYVQSCVVYRHSGNCNCTSAIVVNKHVVCTFSASSQLVPIALIFSSLLIYVFSEHLWLQHVLCFSKNCHRGGNVKMCRRSTRAAEKTWGRIGIGLYMDAVWNIDRPLLFLERSFFPWKFNCMFGCWGMWMFLHDLCYCCSSVLLHFTKWRKKKRLKQHKNEVLHNLKIKWTVDSSPDSLGSLRGSSVGAAQKLPDAPFSLARLSKPSAGFTIPNYIIAVSIAKKCVSI